MSMGEYTAQGSPVDTGEIALYKNYSLLLLLLLLLSAHTLTHIFQGIYVLLECIISMHAECHDLFGTTARGELPDSFTSK